MAEYREKYQAMAALRRQMQALEMDEAEKARRVDTLTYQLQELERAKLRPGEEEELESRAAILAKPPDTAAQCGKIHFRCIRGGFLPQRRRRQ